MFARLSVDTDAVRAYGSAASAHAGELQAAATRLTAVGAGSAAAFGPVGVRFLAALTRAAGEDARAVTALSESLAATQGAATESAQGYEVADADTGTRVSRTW